MKKFIRYSLFQLLCFISFTEFSCGSCSDEDICTIKVFDVGQGNAVGIRYQFKQNDEIKYETMLIDAGSKNCAESTNKYNAYFNDKIKYNEYKQKIISDIKQFMLSDNAIVKSIIVTHAHDDHFNLLPEIFSAKQDQEKINNIVLSGLESHYAKHIVFSSWIRKIENNRIKYTRRKDGEKKFVINENGFKKRASFIDNKNAPKLKLLSINQGKNTRDRNDDSIVLQILCHQTLSVLLTGDATARTWQGVKNLDSALSHVLLIPHHGSKANMLAKTDDGTINIFDFIQPDIAIFSTGLYSRYGHPHNMVYEKIEEKMAYRDDCPFIVSFLDDKKKKLEKRTNNSIFSTVDHGSISLHIPGKPTNKKSSLEIPFNVEIERSQEPIFQFEDSDGNIIETFSYNKKNKVPPVKKLKSHEKLEEDINLERFELKKPKSGGIFLVQKNGEKFKKLAYSPNGKIENAYYFCTVEEVDFSDSEVEYSDEELSAGDDFTTVS